MSTGRKRTTVYFDPNTYRALRMMAAETDQSISYLVNEAVKDSLAEDLEDLAAFDDRAHEVEYRLKEVIEDFQRHGKI